MADISISPDVIRDALKDFVAAYEPTGAAAAEVGTVVDTLGLAQNLDEHEIGVVVLGEFAGIEAGQPVSRTGEVLSTPVGDGFLGRVVDPLGNPIDGLGPVAAEGRRTP
ncbi:MAG: synthase subunit alpha [Microbacterium sp.]|nr:synthase subunit alpha [Microbacterium sp.]